MERPVRPESRAIVFDLDDTLYPYRAFARSGFRVVGRQLADERGLPLTSVLRVLRRALVNGDHGHELQALCARYSLPLSVVPALASAIREHAPTLRLPRASARVLLALRAGWRLGILTNGQPDIQRRKIAALGVRDLVDEVLFASECGEGAGKPAPEAFQAALDRLRTDPQSTVFVGDDPEADMAGAAAVGMHTVHLLEHRPDGSPCAAPRCGVHAERLEQVPAIANQLVPEGIERHAH